MRSSHPLLSRDVARARARAATGAQVSHLGLARLAGLVLVGCLGLGATSVGCAGVHDGSSAGGGGAGPFGSTGGRSGTAGTGGNPRPQGKAGGAGTTTGIDPSDGGQKVGCDGGDACMCPSFKLAVIGKAGKWGANPNGDSDTALQDWLNSSSAGTAQVDNF